ncbi:MAG TPA: YdcF family protein [Reyranella sp.]|nr:YdcF family protein [Reyranella sp.]
MNTFAVLKILAGLTVPPASLVAAVVLAFVLSLCRWRRLARTVLVLAIAETVILSFQPVGDALIGILENRARAAARQSPACCYDAIVVLGGGISPAHPPEQPVPDLSENGDRMWEAARLFRRGVAPRIIVTGGSLLEHGGPPGTEAEAMRLFLVDLGVPAGAILDEPKAQNTIENIRNVRALVGDGRVAVVTSAYHMPRALNLAQRAGLKVGAFPTDYQATPSARLPWENWMPSIDGLGLSILAIREIMALNLDFRSASLAP